MNFLKRVTVVCLSLVFLTTSNAAAISIPDEQKLGKEFMQMVQDQGVVLHDPVARHMINTVGNHIVAVLPPQPFHFDFNLINDDSFNAFASPASNLFVHRGLIATLESMDEFAGVMAHEVAHAASRHVSQSIDRSKMVAIGSLAGMLAGVLLGAAGGGGDVGSALSIGSMAAGQSSMLAFTRENETEADQKAVLFLDKTGYAPEGLLSGLNKIRETDYQGIEGVPDYFKTHPGTGTRIAHLAGILADHKDPANKPAPPENYDYQMVKYRLIGLYGDPDVYLAKVKHKLDEDPDNPALNYGIGLLYGRTHRIDLGITHLHKTLAKEIFNPMVLLELGRLHINNDSHEEALSVLEGITQDKIIGDLATYYSAIAQIEIGKLAAARANLTKVLDRNKKGGFARANYHLANIMSQQQNAPMSHYYLGIYYSERRDFKNAFRHLNRAIETLEDQKIKEDAQTRLDKLRDKAKKQGR